MSKSPKSVVAVMIIDVSIASSLAFTVKPDTPSIAFRAVSRLAAVASPSVDALRLKD